MNLAFTPDGWDDCLYWQATDKAILRRLNRIIEDTLRSPFEGLGKPEQLRHQLAGCWSRRISEEHRLVYRVSNETVVIVMARYHY